MDTEEPTGFEYMSFIIHFLDTSLNLTRFASFCQYTQKWPCGFMRNERFFHMYAYIFQMGIIPMRFHADMPLSIRIHCNAKAHQKRCMANFNSTYPPI